MLFRVGCNTHIHTHKISSRPTLKGRPWKQAGCLKFEIPTDVVIKCPWRLWLQKAMILIVVMRLQRNFYVSTYVFHIWKDFCWQELSSFGSLNLATLLLSIAIFTWKLKGHYYFGRLHSQSLVLFKRVCKSISFAESSAFNKPSLCKYVTNLGIFCTNGITLVQYLFGFRQMKHYKQSRQVSWVFFKSVNILVISYCCKVWCRFVDYLMRHFGLYYSKSLNIALQLY